MKHPLYVVVDEVGLDELADVPHPLHGLRVVPYYGCVLTRPAYLQPPDSSHYPVAMDHLLETLGAEVVPFAAKTKCCGGGVLLSHPEVARDLTGKLLKQAKDAGAQCLAVACPMCHVALDAYQPQVEQRIGERLDLPVLYFTQLMGMALGIEKRRLGLDRLMVSPAKLLAGLEDSE